VLASGGYGNVFYLSTNAKGCNTTATWRAHRKGAYFATPATRRSTRPASRCSGDYQSKLTLMSRVAAQRRPRLGARTAEDCDKDPRQIPEADRDYYLERKYPSFGNLVPRDIASRAAKKVCDEGRGVGPERRRRACARRVPRLRRRHQAPRQGGGRGALRQPLRDVRAITGENPYETPMRIYPAVHYTMGGLWVDYNLMSTIPGLFVLGEANFSDHGANRLGASALMQGLADGYFVLPNTIATTSPCGPYDAGRGTTRGGRGTGERQARINHFLGTGGTRTRPTTTTRSSGRSCGSTAAWSAPSRA
jgi:succinate dehydrogenase / fumarate reductase flavoprotein subunit